MSWTSYISEASSLVPLPGASVVGSALESVAGFFGGGDDEPSNYPDCRANPVAAADVRALFRVPDLKARYDVAIDRIGFKSPSPAVMKSDPDKAARLANSPSDNCSRTDASVNRTLNALIGEMKAREAAVIATQPTTTTPITGAPASSWGVSTGATPTTTTTRNPADAAGLLSSPLMLVLFGIALWALVRSAS